MTRLSHYGIAYWGIVLLLGLGVPVLPGTAQALTADFRACLAKARSEAANAVCARAEFRRQVERLKAVWIKVQSAAKRGRDGQHVALLEEAQKRWRAWRAQHCGFVAVRTTGAYSQAYWRARCQAQLTAQRTTSLTLRLKVYQR